MAFEDRLSGHHPRGWRAIVYYGGLCIAAALAVAVGDNVVLRTVAGVVVVVGLVGPFFLARKARLRRARRRVLARVRAMPSTSMSSARAGERIRVRGRVSEIGEPLMAPLSQREVAYLALWVESRGQLARTGVTYSTNRTLEDGERERIVSGDFLTGEEAKVPDMSAVIAPAFGEWGTDFVVEDADGCRITVTARSARVAAPGRRFAWDQTDYAAQDAALEKLGVDEPLRVGLHYVEYAIASGDLVDVVGVVRRGADGSAAIEAGDGALLIAAKPPA